MEKETSKQANFPSKPESWNKQSMFDYICKCLAIQEERSTKPGSNRCQYRGSEGRKCALGHCIRDSEYQVAFENRSLSEVIEEVPSFNFEMEDFMRDMQRCHDWSDDADGLKDRLRVVAGEFVLDNGCIELIQRWSR